MTHQTPKLTEVHRTDAELLALVAAGDKTAFTELFNKHWDNLYGMAFVLTKSESLAEDAVQEIFTRLWQKRSTLAGVGNFDNYVFIMARNYIFSEFEKLRIRKEHVAALRQYFESNEKTPENLLLEKESAALVKKAVRSLPAQQQQVFLLSRNEGKTHQEIADLLGISINTVRTHLIRARQALTKYLMAQDRGLVWLCALIDIFL